MNKYIPLVIVILLLVIGGGAYLAFQNQKPTLPSQTTPIGKGEGQEGNIFTSIKDALSKSLSLECSYKDEKGAETKTYIKGGAVRVDANLTSAGPEAYSQSIFKDQKMYSWNPETKKGVVFEIPETAMEEAEKLKVTAAAQKPQGDGKGEKFLSEIEKYKNSCKSAAVSDSLFVPPTDVTFQDLSKMMEDVITGMPKNALPSGFDLEELKKQYLPEGQ